ncbi:hypothetical protein [Aminipila sp.]|uniref:hypothetical protein n=1 Tax=Aminipila sp. TaxID=2060095 RepID=UPI0028A1427F|nr:hypothetical protein [Aminipila sp.]
MDPFGISNNINEQYKENMRAIDKKHKEDEEYKKKLLDTTMNLNEIKSIVDQLKLSVEEFNNSSNKISKRMYWLTVSIAVLTVIYTVVAIIQLIKMSQ